MENNLYYQIMGVVKEYCSNNRILDEEAYNKFFNIIIYNIDSKDIIEKLVLINRNNRKEDINSKYTNGIAAFFAEALYDRKDRTLVLYDDIIKKEAEKELPQNLSDKDSITFINMYIMHSLLHEVEHINQQIKIEHGNDEESELFRFISSNTKETSTTYELNIFERLAEIESYSIVIKLLDDMNVHSCEIYDYFEGSLSREYLKGYNYYNGDYYSNDKEGIFFNPTDRYVFIKGYDGEIYTQLLSFIRTYEQRKKYGLLEEDEYRLLTIEEQKKF